MAEQLACRRAAGHPYDISAVLLTWGSGAGEFCRFDDAARLLREAVMLCERHDFDSRYAQAWPALVCLAQGDWDEVAALAGPQFDLPPDGAKWHPNGTP